MSYQNNPDFDKVYDQHFLTNYQEQGASEAEYPYQQIYQEDQHQQRSEGGEKTVDQLILEEISKHYGYTHSFNSNPFVYQNPIGSNDLPTSTHSSHSLQPQYFQEYAYVQEEYNPKKIDKYKKPLRPSKPIRQASNPNITKRTRPHIFKSNSYNTEKAKSTLSQSIDPDPDPDPQPSDTLFAFNKKKPDFHLDLPVLPPHLELVNSNSSNVSNLIIHDSDLGLDHDNITPSMKPPGTDLTEYFDGGVEGFDFDAYGLKWDPFNINSFKSSDYEEKSDHFSFTEAADDKKSPTTPLSNESPTQPSPSGVYVTGNGLYKTNSGESTSSINSINSTKDKKKKKVPKGANCPVCGKYISRDLSRHLRIHDENGRFRCVFPSLCKHKTMKFNRPYDYKKHLLHFHFNFDDPNGKAANNLTDKLPLMGHCKACHFRSDARTWLDDHVLQPKNSNKCPFVELDPP